ncbi:MAG: hypothetical protein ACXACF_12525, partial [Candidatus Hermodarchaeia archaeon]
ARSFIRQGILRNLGCNPPTLFFSRAYQLVQYLVTHILGIFAVQITETTSNCLDQKIMQPTVLVFIRIF